MKRNARFWTFENNGWVKLTLRPSQQLSHGVGGRTDEGWSFYGCTWEHEGDRVSRHWISDGRDCDGRLTHEGHDFALLSELAAVESYLMEGEKPEQTVLRPDWHDLERAVFDEYAVAAGY